MMASGYYFHDIYLNRSKSALEDLLNRKEKTNF